MNPANLTRDQRRAGAVRLCRRLADEVRSFAPPGLGLHEPAWAKVGELSDRFLDELHDWERSGDVARLRKVSAAYNALVDAWRRAAAEYQGTEAARA